jgi:hypothetical protein
VTRSRASSASAFESLREDCRQPSPHACCARASLPSKTSPLRGPEESSWSPRATLPRGAPRWPRQPALIPTGEPRRGRSAAVWALGRRGASLRSPAECCKGARHTRRARTGGQRLAHEMRRFHERGAGTSATHRRTADALLDVGMGGRAGGRPMARTRRLRRVRVMGGARAGPVPKSCDASLPRRYSRILKATRRLRARLAAVMLGTSGWLAP